MLTRYAFKHVCAYTKNKMPITTNNQPNSYICLWWTNYHFRNYFKNSITAVWNLGYTFPLSVQPGNQHDRMDNVVHIETKFFCSDFKYASHTVLDGRFHTRNVRKHLFQYLIGINSYFARQMLNEQTSNSGGRFLQRTDSPDFL